MSQLRWIGPDSDRANYLFAFTPYDNSLWGESPNLKLCLKAHPGKVPETRREHLGFGVAMHEYKPLDELATVYSQPFKLHSGENRIAIPASILTKAYPYKGETLTITAELLVELEGKTLARLPLERDWISPDRTQAVVKPPENLGRALTKPENHTQLRLNDQSSLISVLAALSTEQRQAFILKLGGYSASLLLAAGLLFMRFAGIFVFPITSNHKDSIGGLLFFYLVMGLYFMPKLYKQLTKETTGKYLDIKFKAPQTIGQQSEIRLSDLFEASSHIPLKQLRLRLVAVQQERYLYRIRVESRNRNSSSASDLERSAANYVSKAEKEDTLLGDNLVRTTPADHGATLYDYQFCHEQAHYVLFDRELGAIAPGEPIQARCDEPLQLAAFFEQLRPPVMLNQHCGLSLEWRLQLVHPQLKDVDIVLSPLRFDPKAFQRG